MSIDAINFISPTATVESLTQSSTVQAGKVDTGFESWLAEQISELNEQIKVADTNAQKLATGESNNLHEVMMSLEKAKTSFELLIQVRNKALESYQEVMRMQI